ncbi:MAG: nucleotidyltransferase domain-containing protein [Endomicrobiia bacterium]
MQKILENFIQEIKNSLGKKLKSITLYGSKASQEDTKYSDYNILIIADDLKITDLNNLTKPVKKWVKHGNPPPLIFDTKTFLSSVDVFPIEFLDIKQNHKILYGENIVEKIEINFKNLRHECEFELKSKLLKLKQLYILTGGKKQKLKKLLIESISTFLVLFKSVIQLLQKQVPAKKTEVLEVIKNEILGINIQPFEKILNLKQDKKETKEYNLQELFEQYTKEIEKVIDFVNNL